MEHLRESEPVAQVREDTEVPESIIMVESNSLSRKKKKKHNAKQFAEKCKLSTGVRAGARARVRARARARVRNGVRARDEIRLRNREKAGMT